MKKADGDLIYNSSFEPIPKKTFNLPGELVIVKIVDPDFKYCPDDFLQEEVIFNPTPKRTFKLEDWDSRRFETWQNHGIVMIAIRK